MPLCFFQAEDGIRDVAVTGVQTCALPISLAGPGRRADRGGEPRSLALVARRWPADRSRGRAAGAGRRHEIGRASGRERGEISVVAVSLKKKTPKNDILHSEIVQHTASSSS